MQPVMKTVLIGKDSICMLILIDYLNIVELSIQGSGLFVMPNAYPLQADVRLFPLFKFIWSAYSI